MQLRYYYLVIFLINFYFWNTSGQSDEDGAPFCPQSFIRKGKHCYFINPYKYHWQIDKKFCDEKDRLEKEIAKANEEKRIKDLEAAEKQLEAAKKELEATKKAEKEKQKEEKKKQRLQEMKDEAKKYPPRTSCPETFTKLGNKCYYKDKDKVYWDNAKNICLNRGASLLKLQSSKERALVSDWLKKEKSYLWTSGVRLEGEKFGYQNGKPLSHIFWNVNQPDEETSGQDCIMLAFNDDNLLYMSDIKCLKIQMPFVCEIELI